MSANSRTSLPSEDTRDREGSGAEAEEKKDSIPQFSFPKLELEGKHYVGEEHNTSSNQIGQVSSVNPNHSREDSPKKKKEADTGEESDQKKKPGRRRKASAPDKEREEKKGFRDFSKRDPSEAAEKRPGKKRRKILWYHIAELILMVGLIVLLFVSLAGCRVSYSSPKGVVKSLINAYEDDNQRRIKACYGQKKEATEDLRELIDSQTAYLKAHNMKGIKIKDCDTLFEEGNTAYVYIIYDLELNEDMDDYPCLSTYITQKKGRRYAVLSPSEITDNLSEVAEVSFRKFMTTDIYRDYMRDYNTFVKKNPGYETRIAQKLGVV